MRLFKVQIRITTQHRRSLTDGGRGRRLGQDWSCMGDYVITITEKGDERDDHDSKVIVIITTDCDDDYND